MAETTEIACSCGRTRLEVRGKPIDSVECCCSSCREAAARMQRLDGATKRAIATCCNTPVYLEFKGGHWLSLYGGLWPEGTMPAPTMRTMASDLPEGAVLPDDIPNAKTQNLRFFARLFGAWVAMGFRNPKTPVTGEINL